MDSNIDMEVNENILNDNFYYLKSNLERQNKIIDIIDKFLMDNFDSNGIIKLK
jgi:hypothetical protein